MAAANAGSKFSGKLTPHHAAACVWFVASVVWFASAAVPHGQSRTAVPMGVLCIAIGAIFAALGEKVRKQDK